MTLSTLAGLLLALGGALGAVLLLAHVFESRRRPDPQGSLWRHIFKE